MTTFFSAGRNGLFRFRGENREKKSVWCLKRNKDAQLVIEAVAARGTMAGREGARSSG